MLSKIVERHRVGIYKITNLVNGEFYIGASREVYNRKHTHISKLKSGVHTSELLMNAYYKYGEDNFLFEVIEYCLEEMKKIKSCLEEMQKIESGLVGTQTPEAKKNIIRYLNKR